MFSGFRVFATAACLVLSSPLFAAFPGDGSIASKVEITANDDSVRVTDLRAVQSDRLLRVQAELTNFSSSDRQVYYRFKWLDSNGFSVWDDEAWKPMLIYGGQKQLVSAVPPSLHATDFRLVLHFSRR